MDVRNGCLTNSSLYPSTIARNRLLLLSSFREIVAAGQRGKRSPRESVFENLLANAVKELC